MGASHMATVDVWPIGHVASDKSCGDLGTAMHCNAVVHPGSIVHSTLPVLPLLAVYTSGIPLQGVAQSPGLHARRMPTCRRSRFTVETDLLHQYRPVDLRFTLLLQIVVPVLGMSANSARAFRCHQNASYQCCRLMMLQLMGKIHAQWSATQ